jgi:hypothetical protein
MKNGKLSISLFPDSGHHFYFVPLAISAGKAGEIFAKENKLPKLSPPSLEALITLCNSDPEWFPARRRDGREMTWLRAKFGTKKEKIFADQTSLVYGLWCAVETNTGTRRSGYIFDTDSWPAEDDRGWKAWQENPDQSSPYIANRPEDIVLDRKITADLDEIFGLSTKLGSSVDSCILEINWPKEGGNPIPVHLIVDFGNTRTVAIGLEMAERTAITNFRETFRPISFQRGYDDAATVNAHTAATEELIPESWIILREPIFSGELFTPPHFMWPDYSTTELRTGLVDEWISKFSSKRRGATSKRLVRITNRVPYMFIEFSPVVMGLEGTDLLANVDIVGGHLSFLSSPKRYAWDNDPVGEGGTSVWYMHPRTISGRMRQLEGEMFRFLPRSPRKRIEITEDANPRPPSPTDWDESERPTAKPSPPNFGRADALIWAGLSILERASKQIQSEAWRSKDIRRYLDTVVVTFPPGWTSQELLAYWRAWYLANEIYNWSHNSRPVRIALDLRLDEAVASQLAIVFSEIRRRENRGRDWVAEKGQLRGDKHTIRVLTIDIGGGTLDTAIVEYYDAATVPVCVHLVTEILFRDSSTNAGDKLVKDLIERVILPTMGERFRSDPARRAEFENFFASSPVMREAESRLRRMVITRSVFVPIVYKWLEDISNGRKGNPATGTGWDPSSCGANATQVERLNLESQKLGLAEEGLLPINQPFDVDYKKIDDIIVEWCKPIAELHSRYLATFECDLVIVTGKPSELPKVQTLLQEQLPIDKDRIIFAKGYDAGDWFPAAIHGKIPDAKLVTVVGAALFSAITSNLIPNWKIEQNISREVRNFWGVFENEKTKFEARHVLLRPDQNEVEAELSTYCQICRARFLNNYPELVYILRWRDRRMAIARGTCTIIVQIRRVCEDYERGFLINEHLELEHVSGQDSNGDPITLDDIELQLRTLGLDELHWLDQGRFTVKWE